MADLPDLTEDCENCAALCCVGLALDKGADFGIEKPAGVPCPNLAPDDRCTIHAQLAERGFPGCVRYACHGAGQRVTQEIFGGRRWRDGGAPLGPMLDAFRAMRMVHEQISLLVTAARLSLPPEAEAQRQALLDRLCPEGGWRTDRLAAAEVEPLRRDVAVFLRGLAPLAAALTSGR